MWEFGYQERYALLDRGFVEHAIENSKKRCAANPGPVGIIDAAGYLAHELARVQAFREGNHRTAHVVCQTFLHNNGLGLLSPIGFDDDELAEHIQGTGVKGKCVYGPEDTIALFRRRLLAIASGQPWKR